MAMKLWWRAGWSSALIEAQAAEYGMALDLVSLDDPETGAQARAEWVRLNPLEQLPTVLLPDGRVLSESAAITLHLADLAQADLLVPRPDAPEYKTFLRWLIWMVAKVHPAANQYSYALQLVNDPIEYRGMQERLAERMEVLWHSAAAEAGTPWFLGERFSALDIYVAVMLHWGPGVDWAAEQVPRLYAIAAATAARPALREVMARNFPEGLGGRL